MKPTLRLLALSLLMMAAAATGYAQCTEIFISEYVEGSGNNKALELYNPTSSPVDLSNYRLAQYNNGSPTAGPFSTLSGILQPYGTRVLVLDKRTGSPVVAAALQAKADTFMNPTNTAEVMYFNGNDAIVLQKTDGTVVDIFGRIGHDPVTGWGTGALTANHTLVRKSSVQRGVTTNPATFDPTVEWDVYAVDFFDSLGSHTSTCNMPQCSILLTATQTNVSCFGGNDGSVTLSTTGGTTPYTYNGTAIANLTAGTYTYIVTDGVGCKDTATVTITQPNVLAVTVTDRDHTCGGPVNDGRAYAAVIGGTGPYTLAWSGGTPNTAGDTISGLTAGNYTVTVTDSKGCSVTGTTQITTPVTAQQPAQIMGSNAVCTGNQTYSVPTQTGVTFTWAVSGGGTVTPNNEQATINWTAAGTYTVSVTANAPVCGNAPVQTLQVTVSAAPTLPVITGADTLCLPATESYSAASTGAASYTWTLANGGTLTPNGNAASVVWSAVGTHVVSVTATNQCGTSTAGTLTVRTGNPSVGLGNDTTACSQVDFNVTGFAAIQWSTGATTNQVSITQTGNVGVTVTDNLGCQASDDVNVTIAPAAALNLPATANACDSYTVVAPTGFAAYVWSDGQNTATATFTQNGTYTLTATDANGCEAIDGITLTITNSTPLNLPASGSDCETVVITAPNGFTGYAWSNGQNTPTGTFTQSGTYTLSATDTNGCTVTDDVVVTIFPEPVVGIPAAAQGCEDVDITATGGFTAYVWSDGQTTQTATFDVAGTYGLTVTDANGCTNSASTTVTLNVEPLADFTYVANELEVDFTFSGSGADSYVWDFGNGASSTDASPTVTYATDGSYQVTLVATNACGSDTLTETVTVITIGIKDLTGISALKVYPNPAHGQLQATWAAVQGTAVLEVYNTLGGRISIAEADAMNGSHTLNVQNLANGIYLLRIQIGAESKLVRFVKE